MLIGNGFPFLIDTRGLMFYDCWYHREHLRDESA
jgi:hypothetical protein